MDKIRNKFSRKLVTAVSLALILVLAIPSQILAINIEESQLDGVLYPLYDDAVASGCTQATILAGDTNEEKIWNYLISNMGMTATQAAGILGNIQQESGFSPTALNSSSGAYGIIQWYAGRKTALQNFATEQGKDMSDIGLQLDFMKVELESDYYKTRVLDPIMAITGDSEADLREVTRIWLEHFEIPCIAGSSECIAELNDRRLPYAQNWLVAFGSGVSSHTSSGTGSCYGGLNGNVQCPAVLEPHGSRSGYFRLPDAPNEEYTIYSGEDDRYGSQQLVCVLYTVGLAFNEAMQGRSRLRIGDLNASGHKSHKWGVAVDLSGEGELQVASHIKDWKGIYDREGTVLLGKMFADTGELRNIWWCDPGDGSAEEIRAYAEAAGNLEGDIRCIEGHADHFHVDIKAEYRLEEWTP